VADKSVASASEPLDLLRRALRWASALALLLGQSSSLRERCSIASGGTGGGESSRPDRPDSRHHVFHYPTASRRLLYSAARLEFIGNYASSDQDYRRTPFA
jgi:hypothetical protein